MQLTKEEIGILVDLVLNQLDRNDKLIVNSGGLAQPMPDNIALTILRTKLAMAYQDRRNGYREARHTAPLPTLNHLVQAPPTPKES